LHAESEAINFLRPSDYFNYHQI